MLVPAWEAVPCPNCNGKGKCDECKGSGKCSLCGGVGHTTASGIADRVLSMPGSFATASCSFCGKQKEQVRQMFRGERGANICIECVEFCAELIEDNPAPGVTP